jgi:uncharacterized membrane protein
MIKNLENLDNIIDNYQYNEDKIGIVTGESGLALLLAQLYHYSKNEKYLNQMNLLIDKIIEKKVADFSLGYGWCGFAWVLLQIQKLNLLDDINEWFKDIDRVIEKEFYLYLNKENLDYFDGVSGLLFYFIEKDVINQSINNMAEAYINCISDKIDNNKWELDVYNPETKQIDKVINLGVPHGITGLLLLAILIQQNKIVDCQNIIKQLIDVILGYEIKELNTSFRFPSRIINGINKPTDLAWCYGDLMIGYGIIKAGYLLNDDYYKNYGLKILTETILNENNREDNLILCHGYPSISHIYNCIYQLTAEKYFKEQSEKWKKASEISL